MKRSHAQSQQADDRAGAGQGDLWRSHDRHADGPDRCERRRPVLRPVVSFGVNGHEYFLHAWEFGPRKAKEMLFTGEIFTAQECHHLGMVNHVVPRDELEAFTLQRAAYRDSSVDRPQACQAGDQFQYGRTVTASGHDRCLGDAPCRSRARTRAIRHACRSCRSRDHPPASGSSDARWDWV